jgi:hypothetical protein
MRAFPKLSLLYSIWSDKVQESGNVSIALGQEVIRVERPKGTEGVVKVYSRQTRGTDNNQEVVGPGDKINCKEFDELILAVDADAAKVILGSGATWMEEKVLGNVKVLEFPSLWSIFFSYDKFPSSIFGMLP